MPMEAENGRVALDRVRQGGVHLVLSGWNMPEMNGITLLRALRREGIARPVWLHHLRVDGAHSPGGT